MVCLETTTFTHVVGSQAKLSLGYMNGGGEGERRQMTHQKRASCQNLGGEKETLDNNKIFFMRTSMLYAAYLTPVMNLIYNPFITFKFQIHAPSEQTNSSTLEFRSSKEQNAFKTGT